MPVLADSMKASNEAKPIESTVTTPLIGTGEVERSTADALYPATSATLTLDMAHVTGGSRKPQEGAHGDTAT